MVKRVSVDSKGEQMTAEDIERVYRISAEKIADTSLLLKRYSYADIDMV